MKKILFWAIICLNCSVNASAATITALTNGNWISAGTWDAGRAPADNDIVIIPASKVVSFNGAPYPKNSPATRPTLTIKIYGTLDFSTAGNDKLYLGAGSTIQVFTNGSIQTTTSSAEIIAIYTGSTDNTVWTGTPSTINGPASATASTILFSNALLPVTFESFTIKKDNKGFATLLWTTSAEMNSLRFEIERSSSQSSSWQYAGFVNAAGGFSSVRRYSFSAPLSHGENLFRLKEIDIDGKFSYSNIVSIKYNEEDNIIVTYNHATSQLSLKSQANDQLKIQIYDASGHRLYTGAASAPITFQPASKGVYFVNVVSGDARFARKIMVY